MAKQYWSTIPCSEGKQSLSMLELNASVMIKEKETIRNSMVHIQQILAIIYQSQKDRSILCGHKYDLDNCDKYLKKSK